MEVMFSFSNKYWNACFHLIAENIKFWIGDLDFHITYMYIYSFFLLYNHICAQLMPLEWKKKNVVLRLLPCIVIFIVLLCMYGYEMYATYSKSQNFISKMFYYFATTVENLIRNIKPSPLSTLAAHTHS